ncbi:MAG: sigma-70 family RNA polymerase sigma factor [Clostridia bacterium]|nr:sigma-70 family RNA polymerase sigma factor [Clostridia bacterium]
MFSGILSLFSSFIHFILGLNTPQTYPPPLSSDEESRLFAILESKGSKAQAAREKLIMHNLRLVSHIVRKYYATAKNQEDLVSIGTLGLIKAVDSFRADSGARFATYASKCIQNEILMHFRSQKKLAAEVSLCDTIDVDRDGNPLTYMDVICTDESLESEISRKLTGQSAMRLVQSSLDSRQRQIIILRYGLCGKAPMTQKQVAEKLGISRSYVSRIEKSALERLRVSIGSR